VNKTNYTKSQKFFYILLGTISLGLGIIGLILPVLPTTPFILFSSWCYYRGSERFHDWLINHPYLGKIVEEYSDKEGITRDSKAKAIGLTWIAVSLTAIFILESIFMRALIILLAIIGTIIILRLKTRE
jgi:uncharacterized membrane protein YbaN (DUF454 family)